MVQVDEDSGPLEANCVWGDTAATSLSCSTGVGSHRSMFLLHCLPGSPANTKGNRTKGHIALYGCCRQSMSDYTCLLHKLPSTLSNMSKGIHSHVEWQCRCSRVGHATAWPSSSPRGIKGY